MAKLIQIPYSPRLWSVDFHETKKRFRCLCLHRRAGKTVAAINDSMKGALTDPKVLADERSLNYTEEKLKEWRSTPRLFAIILPFYNQAKSVAWDLLKYYASVVPGVKFNEQELRVDFPNFGRVRLFGADNPNSLRGLKFWDVKLDEFQQHPPDMWKEVLMPACLDTQAPITFMGTIIGKGHLWRLHDEHKADPEWLCRYIKASQSKLIPPQILESERRIMGEAKFLQEYELEPMAVIDGAIYGTEMRWLRSNNHIVNIPIEENVDVDTYWDLGFGDYTVVVFLQKVGKERRIIDCYHTHNQSLAETAKVLQEKGYRYGTHYLPHDAANHDLSTGISRVDFLENALNSKGRTEVIERPKKKEDAVQSVKIHYQKLWIDQKLDRLLEALEMYQQEFDEKRGVFTEIPKHNWASHFADAVQLWAQQEAQTVQDYVQYEYDVQFVPPRY